MNLQIILKEIKGRAIQEVVSDLHGIVDRIRKEEISYQQGSVEITGDKHIIQAMMFDFAMNKTFKSIEANK